MAGVLVATAAPAQATVVECAVVGSPPQAQCFTGYQTYPNPPNSPGLRTSMDGRVFGTEYSNSDEVATWITVWDLSTDGYRARVWFYLYEGCWCTSEEYKVQPVPGTPTHLGSTRLFDSTSSSGSYYYWPYVGRKETTWYTARFVLGRYQGSTGAYDRYCCDKEQIFYLKVTR